MRTLLILGALVTAGCCNAPVQNVGQPASVEDVVKKIKVDLDRYQRYNAVASQDRPLPNACGGKVSFAVKAVKVQLTTQTTETVAESASLTLPVGSGTFGPSLSRSTQTKGTQTLSFLLVPRPVEKLDDKAARAAAQQLIDPGQFPIAAALQQLREGLLRASSQEPCFDLVPAPSESPNTFAFGFTVINDASAGGELKFAVFSVGASTESQRTAGNTITVAFEAAGGSTMFR